VPIKYNKTKYYITGVYRVWRRAVLILDHGTEMTYVFRFTLQSVCALGKSFIRIRHGNFVGLRDFCTGWRTEHSVPAKNRTQALQFVTGHSSDISSMAAYKTANSNEPCVTDNKTNKSLRWQNWLEGSLAPRENVACGSTRGDIDDTVFDNDCT